MGKIVGFEACRAEYAALWRDCEVRPERKAAALQRARKILGNRPRYDVISRKTGVPWFVVGIIHDMECGLDFNKHLHNGDPLRARTVLVPAGRPKVWPPHGDPFEVSAIDALTMPGKEFDKVKEWTIERIAYSLELYNGFGYRLYRKIHSPYLWSFTTHYSRGKYIADGTWSTSAVSAQCGAMALLKALIELDPLQIDIPDPEAPKVWPKADAPSSASVPSIGPVKEAAQSGSVWATLSAAFLSVGEYLFGAVSKLTSGVETALSLVPKVGSEVDTVLTPLSSLGQIMKINVGSLSATVALVCMLVVVVRHTRDKRELRRLREQAGEMEVDK